MSSKQYTTVGDLDVDKRPDLTLVQNSCEVNHILDMMGIDGNYGCLFVNVENGDYTEVWGTKQSVPFLQYTAERLL